ncbi:MAG: chloride channel protein [Gammaproteobacteria bacterium]|nr:chloride channel protein [Gammaproteobacteria bacterium]
MLKKTLNIIRKSNSHLLRLSSLGFLSGLVAAIIIVAFRYLIEFTQSALLPGNNPENYEALSPIAIFLFPLTGGILIGIIFHFLPPASRVTGLIHTIDAIKNHKGHLPFINTIAQFVGAAISIIAGHSVGREGPSIHLGASGGSLIANSFHVTEQTKRILLACGAAAAIAASFNTPIAGVIFSLEIIMLEYTAISTIPIIIASLTATIVSHAVFGNAITLDAPDLGAIATIELPGMILNGVIIGLVAVAFIRLLVTVTQKSKTHPIFWRLTLAGAITGILALIAPEIMSIGYDTITDTFHNSITLYALLVILVLKLLATTIGLGLGLPGGLIGPTLVIGALTGAAVGVVLQQIFPGTTTSPGMYAMIGMGAMMGATLQAPLAALIAIFELTLNTHIILPGLLAIVAASLTSSELLKQPSIIFALMRAKEIDHDEELLTDSLRSLSIERLIKPINDPDNVNIYNLKQIPHDATMAEAVANFRKTHNNQLYVYDNNDTSKTMLGIINRRDLSDFIENYDNN